MTSKIFDVSHTIRILLNARLRPLDRASRYEDPLQEALDAQAPGSRVTDGGTLLSPEREVQSCDFDIELDGDPDTGLRLVIDTLDALGAPRGSKATVDDRPWIPFGNNEGVGLYLNGTDLPDEIYATSDVNELIEQLHARLGDEGSMQSWWQGPRETALYLYGPSASRMRELIHDVVATHPLAQQSRLVDLT